VITVTAKPDPFKFSEAINKKVNARLAADLESRIKARIDPGFGMPGAEEAGITRVAAEGNRLVIQKDKPTRPDDVGLRSPATRSVRDTLFKTVTLDAALSMRTMEETAFVDTQTQHLLGLDYPRHLEAAIKEILSERPSMFYNEERV
jgi:hypothetical protein